MAEAMPGMAGLPPQAATQAPAGPAETMTPENLAVFEQMRQEIPPSEFSEDLLSTAAEADPMAVAEFKAELRGLDLPPEALDVLNQMVDEILASPERYPEIREKYLAQDIPEEMLPPTFDPEFFGALNLAVDEIRATGGAELPPQGFANGGLATLKPMAAAMAQQGRYGDTMLAHISPREARILRQMGGSGTINPNTGLPEFFLKGLFKGIKKGLSKIARAAKKFVRSKVGRIVTTLALAFFLGPAAAAAIGVTSTAGVAAVAGFVGSAGSTALAGGNLKESLKAGAIGGLVGGAGAGVFGGAEAFQAGSYTGPTTIAGQVQKAKDFFTGGGQEAALTDPTQAAAETVTDVQEVAAGIPATGDTSAGIVRTDITMPQPEIAAGGIETLATEAVTPPDAFRFYEAGRGAATAPPVTTGATSVPIVESVGVPGPNVAQLGVDNLGQSQNLFQRGLDKILPNRIQATAEAASGEAFKPAYDQMYQSVVGTVGEEQAKLLATKAGENAMAAAAKVGPLAKYGPLAATGLGVMGLTGGFKAEEPQIPEGFEGIMGTPGMDLLRQYPELYGLRFGGVQPMSTTSPYQTYTPRPVGAAKGGSMDRSKFPRKTGAINGPGTETSDDIPAMLSDGEFVFTSRAVRGMGDGSRRKGAKRMYAMMKKLEGRANG
jgi:hypothetical protein